ncbi:MAG: hypothetical protein A2W03_14945 [Candidatus Aminicenantes bacterium RBG_16_63_16]|nr:MAG: hypothetical protein A2W03_14945 [Candidatus Aminicenantes bacterium RBG_16_63_16]
MVVVVRVMAQEAKRAANRGGTHPRSARLRPEMLGIYKSLRLNYARARPFASTFVELWRHVELKDAREPVVFIRIS